MNPSRTHGNGLSQLLYVERASARRVGWEGNSPVDAGDVDDHVDHVAAQLVRLHVDRGAVGGDVDLADHVKQEGLLDPWILSPERQGGKKKETAIGKRPDRQCWAVQNATTTSGWSLQFAQF